MEAEQLNRFERAYKRLNTSKSPPVPADIWLLIASAFASLGVADLTGYPEKYVAPITVFFVEGGYQLGKSRGKSWKKVAIFAVACAVWFFVAAKYF